MEKKYGSRIEAVDRAMTLLVLLGERESLSVTDAAAELGVAPSTAHRLLTTMTGRGFVAQGPGKRYRAGPVLLGLRPSVNRSIPALTAKLRPLMQAVHDDVGESVHLMVPAGADVQFVYRIEADQTLRTGLRIGSRIPAYCTSGGKAILAALAPGTVDLLHAGGLRPWPGRRIRTLSELRAELDRVRRAGYAVNTESEVGVAAVGVALVPDGGEPVAAISIVAPNAWFGGGDEERFAARLRAAQAEAQAVL